MSNRSHQNLERQTGKGLEDHFNLDDAFSDGEDQDDALEFSSAAIRKHLAEQQSWASRNGHEEEQATETSSVNEHDTSISTLYLDGRSCHSKSDSMSQSAPPDTPQTPAELELPQDLSNISLSEDPEVSNQTNGHSDASDEGEYVDTEASYPAVHIDVSKPPSSRVIITTENGDSVHHPEPPRVLLESSDTGKPSSPASASQHPEGELSIITASTSLPLPPNITQSQPNHRPSRSTGPTTFQKVLSKTRPHFLPPKSREEDRKHLADWETMMKQSRAAGNDFHGTRHIRDTEIEIFQRRSDGRLFKNVGWHESLKSSNRYMYGRRKSSLTGASYTEIRVLEKFGGTVYRQSYGHPCGSALLATRSP